MLTHRFGSDAEIASILASNGARSTHLTLGWSESLHMGLGYKTRAVVTERAGKTVWIQLYYEAKKGPFRLIGSPLRGSMTPYLPPIQAAAPLAECLAGQWAFLRGEGYHWIEWGMLEAPPDQWAKLQTATGARAVTRSTFRLTLTGSTEEQWDALNKRARTAIRNAKNKGLVVKEAPAGQDHALRFYRMLTSTFKKSGRRPPHPLEFYTEALKRMRGEGRLLFLEAEADGSAVAAGLFLHGAGEMHFLSGASLPEAKGMNADNLIHWTAIENARALGLSVYDLGGAGIASIDRFKESLGGIRHDFSWLCWQSPLAAFAQTAVEGFNGVKAKLLELTRGGR